MEDSKAKALIARNLQRLLRQRGWSQLYLAQQSGETEMTISRTARGTNTTSAAVLKNLADALGVSTDEFFRNSDQKGP